MSIVLRGIKPLFYNWFSLQNLFHEDIPLDGALFFSMDKILRPERFGVDPNSSQAVKAWKHWHRTFTNFLSSVSEQKPDKLNVLINYVSPSIYDYISESKTYDEAIETLQSLYIKPKNEIFARHLLATRRQQAGESLEEFLQALKLLSADCNFKTVSVEKYKEESIRDAFISGLLFPTIRQRLLENMNLDLQTAFDQARALYLAQKNSESYSSFSSTSASSTRGLPDSSSEVSLLQQDSSPVSQISATRKQTCYFCGNLRHARANCPARDVTCNKCKKKGHFAKVCKSYVSSAALQESTSATLQSTNTVTNANFPALATLCASNLQSLSNSITKIYINGNETTALVDTGSTESFISQEFALKLGLQVHHATGKVSMASSSLTSDIIGYCIVDISLKGKLYCRIRLSVLHNLCSAVILGHDFLKQHSKVSVTFGGSEPPLDICGLSTLSIAPPSLFANLSPNCKPIATKSRRYSSEDRNFISKETQKLLSEGIIEPSNSPWRAQVVVTVNENHKKRMVIDYSQTINRYTQLDAYPLPRINEIVNKVARYKYYSTIDLKSAYHQIPLCDQDKAYTAFEADGRLYQFCRMPFGLTNAVACFQRMMDEFISNNDLRDTFNFLDDITVCGSTKEDHDENLKKFLEAVKSFNITLNYDKCTFSATSINLLGYHISNGEITPDPARLQPLKDLPAPSNLKSLRRVTGMFSYYSQWIKSFSEKIRPLITATKFPLDASAQEAFEGLKKDILDAVVMSIDENVPFVVETDASENAIAATLNQEGKPVAFFSRTLNKSEKRHSAVEKEAYAIVEAIRKWRHFLSGRHFTLITDQKSVSFMFDCSTGNKIKNDKILRWRLELACYSCDIKYRPGIENSSADLFSRAYCSAVSSSSDLLQLHNSLCHPGITRMIHFVRSRNLPFSVEDVKRVISSCPVCLECKPRFNQVQLSKLIKATHPFERLNMDFKGPLPSSSRNRYMLTIVDEFSRFPFAFPCPDISSQTVIKCLLQLFSIFGMPAYIHTDRGTSFMSIELKEFLTRHGIATSKTTPYNPQGNGQCERYNGIIWKTITLALKSCNMSTSNWEIVLPDSLHSIRSLLCTSINATPHERMFQFSRRSTSGQSIPSWLMTPGKVFLKKHIRESKYDPLVEEVELLETNPNYAHIRLSNGKETTVSLKHLSPSSNPLLPGNITSPESSDGSPLDSLSEKPLSPESMTLSQDNEPYVECQSPSSFEVPEERPLPRRSLRNRHPPDRLQL